MNKSLTILSFATTAVLAFDAGIIAEQYRSGGVSRSSLKTINNSRRNATDDNIPSKKANLKDWKLITQRGCSPAAAAVNMNQSHFLNNASRLRGQTTVDGNTRNSHEVPYSIYHPLRAGPMVHSGNDGWLSSDLKGQTLQPRSNPAREAIYQTLSLLWRAESSCGQRMSGDSGAARGHLQFHEGTWKDALIYLGLQDNLSWQWPQAANDLWRCYVVEIAHWQRYCPKALEHGDIETLVRAHRLPSNPYRADNSIYLANVMKGIK